MSVSPAHEFFLGSAGVAGALIGLLFVAISLRPERALSVDDSEIRGIRAAAALTAFTNALTVSLFGLVPATNDVGGAATIVAIVGLLFVSGALFDAIPAWRGGRVRARDLVFLLGLIVVFAIQLVVGFELHENEHDTGYLQTICDLVIVCFLIGITRAWELVGGPDVGLGHQLFRRLGRGRPRL
jgi:hypothetical protein